MRKIIFMIIFVCIGLFLISCQGTFSSEKEKSIEAGGIATACTPKWECADENYKVYVSEDCTRKEAAIKCERGCVEGECRAAEVCTTGFKCIDDFRRGYQKEDCSFISEKDCEWGCDLGKCQDKPANIFENASEAPVTPKYSAIEENQEDEQLEPERTVYTLKVGEQQELQTSLGKANISIHFLEPAQVTLKVNGIK